MRAFISVLLLSFTVSALAYNITAPNPSENWNTTGPNVLSWINELPTDPHNFTAVLTNQDRNVMPIDNQVLAALVDGTLGSIVANPPSGGWPIGSGFRVNLVLNPDSLGSILTQSLQFNISSPPGSSTTAAASTAATAAQPYIASSSSTDPLAKPTGNSNGAQAVLSVTLQVGFASAIAMLAVLA